MWLFGGGAAFATLSPWERGLSDANSFTALDGELIPGRFMYDYAHWRSRVDTKRLIRFADLNWNHPRFNGTSPGRGWAGAPDYSKLLARAPRLTTRSTSNPADSLPPLRKPDAWYAFQFSGELLIDPNFILEDIDGSGSGEVSTLDTLYISGGGQADVNERPIMTYYHGTDFRAANLATEVPGLPQLESRAYFVFSGFPLWVFSRPQQQAIVDFVLQDIWGLTKTTPVPMSSLRAPAHSPGQRLAPPPARPLRRPRVRR